MPTGSIPKGTDPTGSHVATDSFSEDAVTKHAQRLSICASNGKTITAVDTASAPAVTSADTTATGKTALAANANSVGFLMQNLSDDTIVEWRYGTTVTVGTAFKLLPGQYLEERGLGLCRDAIRVITAAGTASIVTQEW